MNDDPTQLLTDGKLQGSASKKTFSTLDPVTEEIITGMAEGGKKDAYKETKTMTILEK